MKKLNFRRHAEMRMRERNITEAEVREALAQPKDQHFYNPHHGRMNVRHQFPGIGLTILVGYEDRPDEIVIVTVIDEEWETQKVYIERDEEFNLLYISFRDSREEGDVAQTKEIVPGAYLDLDSDGLLLGLEIVNAEAVLGIPVSDLHLSGELLGVKEAAELVGKDRANFLRDLASKPDFPEPVARLASGQVWLSKEIERYVEKRNSASEQQQRINQAAEQFADAVRGSYQALAERTVSSHEQGAQLTQDFFNRVIDNLRAQAEDTSQIAQRMADQQQRFTEAEQALTQESVDAYVEFVNSMFNFWRKSGKAAQRAGGSA